MHIDYSDDQIYIGNIWTFLGEQAAAVLDWTETITAYVLLLESYSTSVTMTESIVHDTAVYESITANVEIGDTG